jgi:WD40 repeat protein
MLLALALAATWLAWLILPPRPLREWATVSRSLNEAYLSPDRTRLVGTTYRSFWVPHQPSVPEFGPVRLWDLATGHERLTAGSGPSATAPFTLRLAPDGSWLLTKRPLEVPGQVALQLWDTETGRERWSIPIDAHRMAVDHFVVSPDGRLVACRRTDGTAEVLVMATGQVQWPLGDAWPLTFVAGGQLLVTASPDPATVTLWDTASGRPRTRLTTKHRFPSAAALSPDGHRLAVALWENAAGRGAPAVVELWDLPSGERVADLDFGGGGDDGLGGLTFCADGSLLVAPSTDGSQRLWDVTQSPPRPIDIHGRLSFARGRSWPDQTPAYPHFSPDGTRFVGPGPDEETLAFRETATPDRAVIVPLKAWSIDRPLFAPDGRTLAVLYPPDYLSPWQWAINRLCQSFDWPEPYALDRCHVVYHDATTGAVRGQMEHLPDGTRLIGFSPGGRTIWTVTRIPDDDGGDGILRVQEWAVPTGWPPWWLVAVTAVGVLLAIADWRRSRRRAATGGPAS